MTKFQVRLRSPSGQERTVHATAPDIITAVESVISDEEEVVVVEELIGGIWNPVDGGALGEPTSADALCRFRLHYTASGVEDAVQSVTVARCAETAKKKLAREVDDVEIVGVEKEEGSSWTLVEGRRAGPVRFTVKGVDRETSEDVRIEIEAESEESAQVKARLKNIEPIAVVTTSQGKKTHDAATSRSSEEMNGTSVAVIIGIVVLGYVAMYITYGKKVEDQTEMLLKNNGFGGVEVVRSDYGFSAPLSRRSDVSVVVRSGRSETVIDVDVRGNPIYSSESYISIDGFEMMRLELM